MLNIVSSSRYKINRKLLRKVGTEFLLKNSIPNNVEINLIFIGKNKMKDLVAKYKKEDEALPVLSFKYNETVENESLLGEVFICYPQAILLAAEREKKVDNIIIYLMEHGISNLFQ